MKTVALTHGYPPFWNMGGEVSLHRTMKALNGQKHVLTNTEEPYVFEGVNVEKVDLENVLKIHSNPRPVTHQLRKMKADVVIGQSELSLVAVNAAYDAGAISVVNVHAPPVFGGGIQEAVRISDYAIYNTHESAKLWGEPNAFVLHPPISPLPEKINNTGDAYTVLSSLRNKGVEVVLYLAKFYPNRRFIIVRSPAEPTHGLPDLEERASKLPNVELHPRVPPEEVYKYLEQTRILLVPSMYETYGMSAIEAAGYGIPSIHVDTPHVREGIGDAAILIPGMNVDAALRAIDKIEANYDQYSKAAREKAEWISNRQDEEFKNLALYIDNLKKPIDKAKRRKAIEAAFKKNKDVRY
jgi:glycosyltransferase involved in cell wall biosynthesis